MHVKKNTDLNNNRIIYILKVKQEQLLIQIRSRYNLEINVRS